jgi:SAM-dependent methyltransferase
MRSCLVCGSHESCFLTQAYDRLEVVPGAVYEVFKCSNCRFAWTEPTLTEEVLADYYPSTYLGNTERIIEEFLSGSLVGTSSWRMETEKVALLERYMDGGRILDIGCAEGKFLWALDPSKWGRFGVEHDMATVAMVNSRLPDLCVFPGSIDSDHLTPGCFDAVTFWHVLEHIPNPRKVLRRVFELMKKNGIVVISLPNVESLQANWFLKHWYAFTDVPRHLYHFSPASLEELLVSTGFSIRSRLFFSKAVNFHCWKHSMRSWTKEALGTQVFYPLLKPLLHLLPLAESLTGRYGVMTYVAEKSSVPQNQ